MTNTSEDNHPYRKAMEAISLERVPAIPAEDFVIKNKSWRKALYNCGHRGPRKFGLEVLGEDYTPAKAFFKDRPMCPDCLHGGAIRCAVCGKPIMIGESIAAYGSSIDCNQEWKTCVGKTVIGCLRSECVPTLAAYCGSWTGSGIDSPFKTGSSAGDALAGGGIVSVSFGPDGAKVTNHNKKSR